MRVAALVLAAGRGERLRRSLPTPSAEASPPKAFLAVGGRSLLAHSLAALQAAPALEGVMPVVPPGWLGRWAGAAGVEPEAPGLLPAVEGGALRQDSVAAGLAALPPTVEHVAIHDAARPLVHPEAVSRVLTAALVHGAAFLAEPVADTIHRADADGNLAETPDRSDLWAAQTPQAFRVDWLREALEKARADGVTGTDDAGLVARCGHPVRVVPGDPANRKITLASDLRWAEIHLAERGS
ncbi:MAG: 2-C-methyl-D-erythritol 4-phosphate cytidylyltransferase [Deltaproteobacteria bacterium]|nr:2-C-methyl-D-erythritol 4-phosphate cytidylyltransferase [Deltaproteobacteria bacterium]